MKRTLALLLSITLLCLPSCETAGGASDLFVAYTGHGIEVSNYLRRCIWEAVNGRRI